MIYMATLLNTIKAADAMVENLGLLFDGRGYDEQGYYAQLFMANIARESAITTSSLNFYVSRMTDVFHEVTWFTQQAEKKAETFLELVATFRDDATDENAIKVIEYTN